MRAKFDIYLIGFFSIILSPVFAFQDPINKKEIDSTIVNRWVNLGNNEDIRLSGDGKYFSYILNNQPYSATTLIIQSVSKKDRLFKKFISGKPGFFSLDNKKYVFTIDTSIYLLDLKTHEITKITGITSFTRIIKKETEWMVVLMKNSNKLNIIQLKNYKNVEFDKVSKYSVSKKGYIAVKFNDNQNTLLVRDLLDGKEIKLTNVIDFKFDNAGGELVYTCKRQTDSATSVSIEWLKIASWKSMLIKLLHGSNSNVPRFCFDNSASQIAIFYKQDNAKSKFALDYCKWGGTSIELLNKDQAQLPVEIIDEDISFTATGKYILINLRDPKIVTPDSNCVSVDIWNYKDTFMKSTEKYTFEKGRYLAAISPKTKQLNRLQHEYEYVKCIVNDKVLIGRNTSGDQFWQSDFSFDSNFWVDMQDGKRQSLNVNCRNFNISPSGNYLIYFDPMQKCNYYSIELSTGKTFKISSSIPDNILGFKNEFYSPIKEPNNNLGTGIAGWLSNDSGLLVYDNYDIWKLDITGRNPSVNITNGYGRKNRTIMRIAGRANFMKQFLDGRLLLNALRLSDFYNGFYSINISKKSDPLELSMGPYVICQAGNGMLPNNANNFSAGMMPIKAENAAIWIVKRMTTNQAPNYFITSNFKNFRALTDYSVPDSINWITSQLVDFVQRDGNKSRGILYKPQNFDPQKKYPVIFNYYEQLSHRVFQFPTPLYTSSAHLNIPWFVSNGYLVFTPDIIFTEGRPGLSAFNSVMGAADILVKETFIDSAKMGICGHSSAGGLTSYIVTHTSRFAAAFVGAGTTDIVSDAFNLAGPGAGEISRLKAIEQTRSSSLWDAKDEWLMDSPILHADRVSTPLLIFHCKNDYSVPWLNAIEMFTALRRLQRKVWLLQYDNGDHFAYDKDAIDLTVRVTQFFDHFLKSSNEPIWMKNGIPFKLKRTINGYDYAK